MAGSRIAVKVNAPSRFENTLHLSDFAIPTVSDILVRPDVFEGCTGGWRTDGGFVLPLGVEWRVKINQVNRLGIHTSHNVKIVCNEECSVFDVHRIFCYFTLR